MALSGNAATIAQYLSSKGLSAAGVAAVLGAWQAESSLNPAVTNSIGAHGLAQWLGSRRIDLQALAHSMGTTENDLTTQLDFWWQEMQQYPSLLHELQTTSNPSQAAVDFVNQYERPGPGGDPSAANNALIFFHGGLPGGSGNPSAGGGVTAQNAGNNPSAPWWTTFFPGLGLGYALDPNEAQQTTQGVGQALTAIADDFMEFVKILTLLTRPSTWVRIGAFLFGLMLLVGALVMLKGSL